MVKKELVKIHNVADLKCAEHPKYLGIIYPSSKRACPACTIIWLAGKFAEHGGVMKVTNIIAKAFKLVAKTTDK